LIIDTAGPAASQWGLELARPGRPVAVAVAIVVTEQIVSSGLTAAGYGERLVDGREEVFC
jgi:hypothetical protein